MNVKGKTILNGGVIASTDAAVNAGLNHFESKGGLELHDIYNSADYKATSIGVSVSTGGSAQSAGLTGSGIGLGYDKGQASSTTTSGISGIAGKTAVRSTDGPTGISKIFNADAVEKDVNAQQQIMQTFTRDAPKAVASYADHQAKDLQKKSNDESDPARKAELSEEAAQWGEGGAKRVALHAATGALSGGLGGALGAGVSAASAPALNTLQDNIEQGLVGAGMNPSLAHGVAQGVTTVAAVGVGAALGGAQGGAAAGTVDANNRALHPSEHQIASSLAAKGKYTKEQIEEQMRLMGNDAYGEQPNTVAVLNTPDAIANNVAQDPGMPNAVSSMSIVEVPGQANMEIQNYITANTRNNVGYIPDQSPYMPSNIKLNRPNVTSTPSSQLATAPCGNMALDCKAGLATGTPKPTGSFGVGYYSGVGGEIEVELDSGVLVGGKVGVGVGYGAHLNAGKTVTGGLAQGASGGYKTSPFVETNPQQPGEVRVGSSLTIGAGVATMGLEGSVSSGINVSGDRASTYTNTGAGVSTAPLMPKIGVELKLNIIEVTAKSPSPTTATKK